MRTLALIVSGAGLLPLAAPAAAQPGPPPAPAHATAGHTWRHGGTIVHHRRDFPRRLHRGGRVHAFWFGPQFHVGNWALYGLGRPYGDQRWIRYYDDAYLIDGTGYVHDTRHGLDWDRYGEHWADHDGIPAYHGSGDFHPTPEDHAWVEEHGDADADHHGRRYAGHGHGYPPAPAHGCAPCGYGHGHYGWAYPMIIVETTVTTTTRGGHVVEEVVEERVAPRPRVRRAPARPAPRAAPPRPRPGERG